MQSQEPKQAEGTELSCVSAEAMQRIWTSLLGVEQLADDSNFFDLGGDSLAAMNLLCCLKQEMGVTIELGILFQHPQFDSFIAAVNRSRKNESVPLEHFHLLHRHPGSIPVFCFAYAPFLAEACSVYFHPGIYEEIHSESDPLTPQRITSVRNNLLAEIKAIWPDGPYRLSGYCHGGWLAMSIAQSLVEDGNEVDFLAFVEMFPRAEWYKPWLTRLLNPRSTLAATAAHGLLRLSQHIAGRKLTQLADRSGTLQRKLVHFQSVYSYRQFERQVFERKAVAPVQLYVHKQLLADDSFPQQIRHWQPRAPLGMDIHPIVDGNHHSVREERNRKSLAAHMIRSLYELDLRRGTTKTKEAIARRQPIRFQTSPNESCTLFKEIIGNRSLQFVDAASNECATAPDMIARYADVRQSCKHLAFVYQDNSLDSVAAILGILHASYAVVLLGSELTRERKEHLEALHMPFVVRDPSRKQIPGYAPWASDVRETIFRRETVDPIVVIHDKVDVLLTTSGTTGSPKFVKLSTDNLLANARSIATYLPIQSADVAPLNLPLDYSYGLSLLTSNSIRGGTIVCSVRSVTDPQFWNDFRNLRMTTIAGTPDFYHLIRGLGFLKWQLPSLRYFTQAGGALDAESVRTFGRYANKTSTQFFVMYGQTEATARMSYLPPELAESHAGSIGRAIPGGRFELDPASSELLYRGPNVFGGYVTDPTDLASYAPPELLRTGDLAAVDQDGIYRITGRLKRIVKILGTRVSLDEMEALLCAEFPGTRFVCLRVDGERVRVVLAGPKAIASDVAAKLRTTLRIPPDVLQVLVVKKLPVTSNGKVDYVRLSSNELSFGVGSAVSV